MKCGLGNWEDVHDQFLQGRSPQECEEHYFSVVYKSTSVDNPKVVYSSVLRERAPATQDCILDEAQVEQQEKVIEAYR